jgi:hypothetical protein
VLFRIKGACSLRVALVKQVLDVFGPWSGVTWTDTSPVKLFEVWPGKAVYWELTCLLQADWYIVPESVGSDYIQDAVRNSTRADILRKNSKNVTQVEAIPFEMYDLAISFDAILAIPSGTSTLFAYYAQEHWDPLYKDSLVQPAAGYDLFLAHMLDAPDRLRSIPQSISFPYLHDPELVRSFFPPAKHEVVSVDWRTLMTLAGKRAGELWCSEAVAARKRLQKVLGIEIHCRTNTWGNRYGISETPAWGDAAHYLREMSECKYYLGVGDIAGAGQALADAASLGCLCVGQADKPYHRLLCHPLCLCQNIVEVPSRFRELRKSASLQQEALAYQETKLKKHFRDDPIAILREAVKMKLRSLSGS